MNIYTDSERLKFVTALDMSSNHVLVHWHVVRTYRVYQSSSHSVSAHEHLDPELLKFCILDIESPLKIELESIWPTGLSSVGPQSGASANIELYKLP